MVVGIVVVVVVGVVVVGVGNGIGSGICNDGGGCNALSRESLSSPIVVALTWLIVSGVVVVGVVVAVGDGGGICSGVGDRVGSGVSEDVVLV